MTPLVTIRTEDLAIAIASSLVISTDQTAMHVSPAYWAHSRPWTEEVVKCILETDDDHLRKTAEIFHRQPEEKIHYNNLIEAVAQASRSNSAGTRKVLHAAGQVVYNARLSYHIGSRYVPASNSDPETGFSRPPVGNDMPVPPRSDRAQVLIVIPFGDHADGERCRNVAACLMSLADQNLARDSYWVTIVEASRRPRWEERFSQYADQYIFAYNPSEASEDVFNKSWALNVGVVNSRIHPDILCLLDSDMLLDRDFIARNAGRFARPGQGAFLPYRDALYLDPGSSNIAVHDRFSKDRAGVDPGKLRGYLLRRPPGGCLWLRTDIFDRIGGMDERLEGWSAGEDNDFFFRLSLETAVDSYDDALVHLYHPSESTYTHPGGYEAYTLATKGWRRPSDIGRLNLYADPGK